ncbi:MAG: AzlC family ABC transporter permease [Candidatus Methylomirabilales bacterium]
MEGQALQILVSTFFINLRFAVMSLALAPHFKRVRTGLLLLGGHLISISTFALSFLRFQRTSMLVAVRAKNALFGMAAGIAAVLILSRIVL